MVLHIKYFCTIPIRPGLVLRCRLQEIDQTWRDHAACVSVGSSKADGRPDTVCPCAPNATSSQLPALAPPKRRAHLRKRACSLPANGVQPLRSPLALPANGVRPCLRRSPASSGSGSLVPPPRPLQPHPSKYEDGYDDSSKENQAGFISAPFFLRRKRLAGEELKRRDKSPRV